ncbi:MAG: M23 family metallopeptidase [Hyphomonadaceae bacterium]|nr:M23 family metallopeptidase [Hyphomonadaceae bacterium]
MVGMIVRLGSLVLVLAVGWVLGTLYPAPDALVAQLNPAALEARAASGLRKIDFDRFQGLLSSDQRAQFFDAAVRARAAAGQVIPVERVAEADMQTFAAPESVASVAPSAAPSGFEPTLVACPGMTVSNGPKVDAARKVVGYAPVVTVGAVKLAANPTKGACLSSGYGPRGGRTHRGVDYHARDGGPILAAGDGVVIELKYRDDYGNMLLIDHGGGVYTRYAHLATFRPGLAVGSRVVAGEQVGLMGNTASYAVPVHLHYEVLTGDYANPKASFGLTPQNVLAAPAAL